MASLGPIKPGDIVEIDKKGRRFHAFVVEKGAGLLTRVRPLEKGITFTTATSREVVKHYKLSNATRDTA